MLIARRVAGGSGRAPGPPPASAAGGPRVEARGPGSSTGITAGAPPLRDPEAERSAERDSERVPGLERDAERDTLRDDERAAREPAGPSPAS